jgi:hypothetical protein
MSHIIPLNTMKINMRLQKDISKTYGKKWNIKCIFSEK